MAEADAGAVQAVIAALQETIGAAQADMDGAGATRAQQAAARQVIALAQAAILDYQAVLAPVGPASISVRAGESLFGIAQRALGDALRYREIQDANGLKGLALSPGQQVLMPPA